MSGAKLAALVVLVIPLGVLLFLGFQFYKRYRYKRTAAKIKLSGERQTGEVDDRELGEVLGGGEWLVQGDLDRPAGNTMKIENEFDPLAAQAETVRDRKAKRRKTLANQDGEVYSTPENSSSEDEESARDRNRLYHINAARIVEDAEEERAAFQQEEEEENPRGDSRDLTLKQKLADQLKGKTMGSAEKVVHRRENSTAQFENILHSVAPAEEVSPDFHQKVTTVPSLPLDTIKRDGKPMNVQPQEPAFSDEEEEEEEEEETEEETEEEVPVDNPDDEDEEEYEYEYEEEEEGHV